MKNSIGWLKIAVCAGFFALLGAWLLFAPPAKIAAVQNESGAPENSQSCAACHQSEYDSQHYAAHQKNVRPATVENVRGDFTNDNRLESASVKASMFTDEGNFYIKFGEESYKIAWVVGVKYIEQYVAEKDGEFYSLPVGYNLAEKRWIYLNDTDFENEKASAARHFQKWKTDCAACHQPNEANLSENPLNLGIACAACHGDAGEHLAAKNSLWAKIGFQTENKIVNPRNLSSDAAMLSCAKCHSRDLDEAGKFTEFRADENPAEIIAAHQSTSQNVEKFWANGAPKFSGNEFQAIVRSVCYTQSKAGGHGITGEKISCASCHSEQKSNGEIARAEKTTVQNCVSCHAQFSDEKTIVEHTKHPINAVADCASCHQPDTVYGRMRFAATHEISVPAPSLTVEKQIPNACNLCHIDQSVNWAIQSSKQLWAERFRDSELSPDARFDQPEAVRLRSSNDSFLQALAADSIKKHLTADQSAALPLEIFQPAALPLVEYFLDGALKPQKKTPNR